MPKKESPTTPPMPEPSAFERMRELTRRIIAVPKSEVAKTKPRKDKHR